MLAFDALICGGKDSDPEIADAIRHRLGNILRQALRYSEVDVWMGLAETGNNRWQDSRRHAGQSSNMYFALQALNKLGHFSTGDFKLGENPPRYGQKPSPNGRQLNLPSIAVEKARP